MGIANAYESFKVAECDRCPLSAIGMKRDELRIANLASHNGHLPDRYGTECMFAGGTVTIRVSWEFDAGGRRLCPTYGGFCLIDRVGIGIFGGNGAAREELADKRSLSGSQYT